MHEKFAALAFTLIVAVQAQEEDDYNTYGTEYVQTPEPTFPVDIAEYLTIPDDFGDFTNNIESVGVALWYDGNDSDIFAWANDDYVVYGRFDFGTPTGDVFMAEVTFIDYVYTYLYHIICFDDTRNCICAGFLDEYYNTLKFDCNKLSEEDGIFDLKPFEEQNTY